MNGFERHGGVIIAKVGEDEFRMLPSAQSIARFLSVKEDEVLTEAGMTKMLSSLVDMLLDANPAPSGTTPIDYKKLIESFVVRNFDPLIEQLSIGMGWADKTRLKEMKSDVKKNQGAKKPLD